MMHRDMNLKGKRILVTGADGFIGSHLTEALLRSGNKVRALAYYNAFNSYGWIDTFPAELFKSLEVVSGDIRDPHGVKKLLSDIDVVFHLAALIGIPFSYHSPDLYVDTNIKGTLNVLQAAKDNGSTRIVHTSTSEVYGTAQFVPITEDHPLNAQSPYAASKIGADQIALSFHRSFGVRVSIVRPFNTYGPRQSARAIIPTVLSQIAKGQSEVRVGAITPTRDFTFVKDLVSGFIAAAESDRSIGEVINLGSNFEISIGDTIELISNIVGKRIEIVSDESRIRPEKSEVNRLFADTSKAQSLLNWKAEYAGIEGFTRGLKNTIEWFQDPQNYKRYKAEDYNI